MNTDNIADAKQSAWNTIASIADALASDDNQQVQQAIRRFGRLNDEIAP